MRRARAIVPLLAALVLFCGCGQSPKKVFGLLKDAAAKRDSQAIWDNVTPDTHKDLAARAVQAAGTSAPSNPLTGQQYLKVLTDGLSEGSVEYIKTLRPGEVTVTGDTALMSVGSYRFGPTDRTLTFKKIDGKWKWDAREILGWYLENKAAVESMGGF